MRFRGIKKKHFKAKLVSNIEMLMDYGTTGDKTKPLSMLEPLHNNY